MPGDLPLWDRPPATWGNIFPNYQFPPEYETVSGKVINFEALAHADPRRYAPPQEPDTVLQRVRQDLGSWITYEYEWDRLHPLIVMLYGNWNPEDYDYGIGSGSDISQGGSGFTGGDYDRDYDGTPDTEAGRNWCANNEIYQQANYTSESGDVIDLCSIPREMLTLSQALDWLFSEYPFLTPEDRIRLTEILAHTGSTPDELQSGEIVGSDPGWEVPETASNYWWVSISKLQGNRKIDVETSGEMLNRVSNQVGEFAGYGAAIGSAIPVVGNALGGFLGATAGLLTAAGEDTRIRAKKLVREIFREIVPGLEKKTFTKNTLTKSKGSILELEAELTLQEVQGLIAAIQEPWEAGNEKLAKAIQSLNVHSGETLGSNRIQLLRVPKAPNDSQEAEQVVQEKNQERMKSAGMFAGVAVVIGLLIWWI